MEPKWVRGETQEKQCTQSALETALGASQIYQPSSNGLLVIDHKDYPLASLHHWIWTSPR